MLTTLTILTMLTTLVWSSYIDHHTHHTHHTELHVSRALTPDTFHENKNISGSPPVVSGPLDNLNYGDKLDGFYVVEHQDLSAVAGYADAASSCGASVSEQKLECDVLEDCVGFSRRRSGRGGY